MLDTLAPLAVANGHPLSPRPTDPPPEPRKKVEPLGPGWTTVTVVVGIMAALIALGGMVLSFRAVSAEMAPAFGSKWAWLVPIVVDLTVFVFSGVDLVLARLDMGHPLARWTVYGATFGTVWLNYSAGGSAAGRTAHVLMPSIWVVFIELMRHVVRRQTNLATGSVREPIPAARWVVSPWPTLKLWRRMILWRQHSYTAALAMERTRLGAIATARQMHGAGWRGQVGPLLRLQIALGEADAAAVATALTLATERPLTGHPDGHGAATDPATARPESGHDNGQNPAAVAAKPRPSARPRPGRDTAGKVAKLAAKHPDWSAAQVAASLGIGERTARRYLNGR
jgi:hypothetical protein